MQKGFMPRFPGKGVRRKGLPRQVGKAIIAGGDGTAEAKLALIALLSVLIQNAAAEIRAWLAYGRIFHRRFYRIAHDYSRRFGHAVAVEQPVAAGLKVGEPFSCDTHNAQGRRIAQKTERRRSDEHGRDSVGVDITRHKDNIIASVLRQNMNRDSGIQRREQINEQGCKGKRNGLQRDV